MKAGERRWQTTWREITNLECIAWPGTKTIKQTSYYQKYCFRSLTATISSRLVHRRVSIKKIKLIWFKITLETRTGKKLVLQAQDRTRLLYLQKNRPTLSFRWQNKTRFKMLITVEIVLLLSSSLSTAQNLASLAAI